MSCSANSRFCGQKNLDTSSEYNYLLVVSTHLKNISQIGSFPQVGMKIKNIWNHHPVKNRHDPLLRPYFLPEGGIGGGYLEDHPS